MSLFHFSEEPDIARFDPVDGLVWAIDDEMAVNYLFPRECPRVTFGAWELTTETDRAWFESLANGARRVLVIEEGWLDLLGACELFRYEFAPDGFGLQDRAAGYYHEIGQLRRSLDASRRELSAAREEIDRLRAEDTWADTGWVQL